MWTPSQHLRAPFLRLEFDSGEIRRAESFLKFAADDKERKGESGVSGVEALPADSRCSFLSEALRELQTDSEKKRGNFRQTGLKYILAFVTSTLFDHEKFSLISVMHLYVSLKPFKLLFHIKSV